MSLEAKTKKRVRRHVLVADDALRRVIDGLDCPEGLLGDDAYVLGQLSNVIEACEMAKSRITDFQEWAKDNSVAADFEDDL